MAAIMEVENPGNPRMETRLGFGIGIGLDLWHYVTLVRTARGASRRAGVRYKHPTVTVYTLHLLKYNTIRKLNIAWGTETTDLEEDPN